jgi:hypothetical protein
MTCKFEFQLKVHVIPIYENRVLPMRDLHEKVQATLSSHDITKKKFQNLTLGYMTKTLNRSLSSDDVTITPLMLKI